MSKQKTEDQTKKISEYLLKNPIQRNTKGCYSEAAKRFGVPNERIRRIYRNLREAGLIEGDEYEATDKPGFNTSASRQFKENVKMNLADVTTITNRVVSLDNLLDVCQVDPTKWEVVSYEVNKWEVGRKEKSVNWKNTDGKIKGKVKDTGKIFVEPLFQVKAKLARKKLAKDMILQKDLILQELKSNINSSTDLKKLAGGVRNLISKKDTRNYLLEISLFDHHFGKLSWSGETSEDYDLKIAEERWDNAIDELLTRVNLSRVERIIFPIGNDMFNVDNKSNMTTAGTPQDSDSRFAKMIQVVKRVLIRTINRLSLIAPVDVICVAGNHDTHSVLWMSEVLDAYYHNNDEVAVDNSPKLRKYYQYGLCGFQYTHGNEEKDRELGLIFAHEEKRMWADTEFRYCKKGHFHKSKTIDYVSTDEYQGFQVKILPSLSGQDYWHYKKGYMSQKAAKAFLYHRDQGLIGEFTYNFN